MNLTEYKDSMEKEIRKLSNEDIAKVKEFTKQIKEYLNNGKPNYFGDLQTYFYALEGEQFNTIKEIFIRRIIRAREELKNGG